jgi:hypothetical protein
MFNSKLAKWFLAWVALMVLVIIVFQPESRPEKIDHVSFNTNEADELYFKNVRLFYYSTNEEGAGAFEVHRLNSLKEAEDMILPFAIYHSWRANEAFIRLDTAFSNLYAGAVLLKDSAGVQLVISELPEPDNVSQYHFAKTAYKALREKSKLGIQHQGKDIWLTETGSRSVRQCLKDYFKLTGKL